MSDEELSRDANALRPYQPPRIISLSERRTQGKAAASSIETTVPTGTQYAPS
jgi:hypothetical protein